MIILFCYNDNLISSCSSYVAEMLCLARCTGDIISNGNKTELDDTKSYCQLIIKITISEKRKIAKLCDKFYIKKLTKDA